jgi:NADPH-dependent 2,4-dienoyl-CoA reductase/sulfur reductase-like enzyme
VLRGMLDAGARKAVVIGAGFIGLETVEAFRHRGLEVALVELAPQVLPAVDADLAQLVEQELRRHDVDVRVGIGFTAVEEGTAGHPVDVVLADGARIPADLVLLGVGVRPSTALAARPVSSARPAAPSSSRRTSGPPTRTSGPWATRSRSTTP